jgi:Uncharacterised protein family (UPF0149)
MNLEMMDEFFAALICGPETVLPSEYLPEIWGGDVVNEPIFQTKPILEEFISLVTQHWNAICRGVGGDEVIHCILDLMYARAPHTVLQRAMHIHPTVSELLPTMMGELKPLAPSLSDDRLGAQPNSRDAP